MVDSPPLERGHIVAGRYRVEARIGQGGMGAVYEVRHVHTDESLALKVLHAHVLKDESAVERFRREARAPARVGSEHVARVTDADTAPDLDGAPFYVMELLRGRDLERILKDEGPLSPLLVVEYLHQAARALDKAHSMGIVHRDLKPENLFLTEREDGTPCIKLLDFGIARLADSNAPAEMKTQAGYVFGTPDFMSPEQAMGDIERVGPATDVWAFGLVAFKLLVGHGFFRANNLAHLYALILSEPIALPSTQGSTFGPTFDAWFAQCVARDGAARFPSVGAAVVALGDALGVRINVPRRSSASLVAIRPSSPELAASDAPPLEPSAPQQTRESLAEVPLPDAPSVLQNVEAPSPPAPRAKSPAVPIAIGLAGILALAAVVGVVFGLREKPQGMVATAASTTSGHVPPGSAAPGGSASDPSASSNATPTPLAVGEATDPRAPAPREVRPGVGGAPAARPATTARGTSATPDAPLTRDQRRRLEGLQRLCDQGTFTATECKTKRLAIMRGDP